MFGPDDDLSWVPYLCWGPAYLIVAVLFGDVMDQETRLGLSVSGGALTFLGVWFVPTRDEHGG